MEYKFVSEESGTKLEEAVNELMMAGWVPLGGVSVAVLRSTWKNDRERYEESETEWVYAQAMTRTPEQAKVAAALRDYLPCALTPELSGERSESARM